MMRAYGAVDRQAERLLGVDARLLYGFSVPVLAIVGVITGLSFHARWWLVALVLVLEIAAMAIVIVGFVRMLGQDDRDEDSVA